MTISFRKHVRALCVLAGLVFLAGCSSYSPSLEPPHGSPPPRDLERPAPITPHSSSGALSLAQLPGWAQEDHAAALQAFEQTCGLVRRPDLAGVCRRARAVGRLDDAEAQDFWQANFRARPVPGRGLLTAYFAPEYEARISRQGSFTAAVRARPGDLISVDLGPFDPTLSGRTLSAQWVGGALMPYPDRAAIEARDTDQVLAWMKPEDLFFLQIQGSGVLRLPDGRRFKASFSASNGRPFVGIAGLLRDRGDLPPDGASGDAVRNWLADHRGPQADGVMRTDPRYVFFRLAPDDGQEPTGAAGAPLIPGRALAMDPARHAMGGLYWIDASAPSLAGAFPAYQRMAVALDIGGAIKGDVRADLYLGRGDTAGAEAGRVRHDLTLYAIVPIDGDAAGS